MEKFSLETNWRLAERLLYNQGCETSTQNQVGREEKQSGWDLCPGREHRRGGAGV